MLSVGTAESWQQLFEHRVRGRQTSLSPHHSQYVTDFSGTPLEGFEMTQSGELRDRQTGKVLNSLGATRFDVAVRALRGELTQGIEDDDTEDRASGRILDSLTIFPAEFEFKVVCKGAGASGRDMPDTFLQDFKNLVTSLAGVSILPQDISVKERMNGKWFSIAIKCVVPSADVVNAVFEELGNDERVVFKY